VKRFRRTGAPSVSVSIILSARGLDWLSVPDPFARRR
jgi:hypothetical protein